MFDRNKEIETAIRREGGSPPTKCAVRFPDDGEWAEWYRGRRLTIQQLGRGASQFDIDTADADLRLYLKICLNGAPELDRAEATAVITGIARREVRSVEVEGDEMIVHMEVPGGEGVSHRLRSPSVKQVAELRRSSSQILSLPYNKQQIRTSLEPAVRLYDACAVAREGYEGAVPAIHKDEAVRAVIQFLELEADEGNP